MSTPNVIFAQPDMSTQHAWIASAVQKWADQVPDGDDDDMEEEEEEEEEEDDDDDDDGEEEEEDDDDDDDGEEMAAAQRLKEADTSAIPGSVRT